MSSLLASTHDTISDSLDGEAYKILKEEEELLHERSEQRNNEGNEVEVRNEPNQITQYLYIGSKIAASNLNLLQQNGITHIINCAKEIPNYFEHYNNEAPWQEELASSGDKPGQYNSNVYKRFIKYLSLKQDDRMDQLIHKQFPAVIEFIDNAREENVNNKVFVHCQAGISRSATCVIAYLMARENMTLKEAFLHTKECRNQIGPNLGFMEELMKYEKDLFQTTETTFSMIDYYIASLVNMGIDEDIATRAVELSEGRFTLALNFALSGSFS